VNREVVGELDRAVGGLGVLQHWVGEEGGAAQAAEHLVDPVVF
jgi:hypothetical protein